MSLRKREEHSYHGFALQVEKAGRAYLPTLPENDLQLNLLDVFQKGLRDRNVAAELRFLPITTLAEALDCINRGILPDGDAPPPTKRKRLSQREAAVVSEQQQIVEPNIRIQVAQPENQQTPNLRTQNYQQPSSTNITHRAVIGTDSTRIVERDDLVENDGTEGIGIFDRRISSRDNKAGMTATRAEKHILWPSVLTSQRCRELCSDLSLTHRPIITKRRWLGTYNPNRQNVPVPPPSKLQSQHATQQAGVPFVPQTDTGKRPLAVAESAAVAATCTGCTRYIHNRVAGLPTWAPPDGTNVNR